MKLNRVFLNDGIEKMIYHSELIDIIFPVKQVVKTLPKDNRDCPCDRGEIKQKLACYTCKKCLQ